MITIAKMEAVSSGMRPWDELESSVPCPRPGPVEAWRRKKKDAQITIKAEVPGQCIEK